MIRHNRILALLLLFAFGIRLALPAGLMLSQGPHGVVVTLCTGVGLRTLVVDPSPAATQGQGNRHDEAPAGKPDANSPCAFAALHAAATPPAQTLLPLPPPVGLAPPQAARAELLLTAVRTTPPATGPPLRL